MPLFGREGGAPILRTKPWYGETVLGYGDTRPRYGHTVPRYGVRVHGPGTRLARSRKKGPPETHHPGTGCSRAGVIPSNWGGHSAG